MTVFCLGFFKKRVCAVQISDIAVTITFFSGASTSSQVFGSLSAMCILFPLVLTAVFGCKTLMQSYLKRRLEDAGLSGPSRASIVYTAASGYSSEFHPLAGHAGPYDARAHVSASPRSQHPHYQDDDSQPLTPQDQEVRSSVWMADDALSPPRAHRSSQAPLAQLRLSRQARAAEGSSALGSPRGGNSSKVARLAADEKLLAADVGPMSSVQSGLPPLRTRTGIGAASAYSEVAGLGDNDAVRLVREQLAAAHEVARGRATGWRADGAEARRSIRAHRDDDNEFLQLAAPPGSTEEGHGSDPMVRYFVDSLELVTDYTPRML